MAPCSRVGHVFRYRRPYKNPAKRDSDSRNNMRTILVWIDEPHYRVRYRYNAKRRKTPISTLQDFIALSSPRLNVSGIDVGDISERVALRQKLQCQTFDWYVRTVNTKLLERYEQATGSSNKSKDEL